MLIAVGKRIAMTAELLMNVVNNVDNRSITKRNMIGESNIPENSLNVELSDEEIRSIYDEATLETTGQQDAE